MSRRHSPHVTSRTLPRTSLCEVSIELVGFLLLRLQEAARTGKVKRPATAYSKFVAENFASVQAANPKLKGVGPIGKLLGKAWSELPEAQKVLQSTTLPLAVHPMLFLSEGYNNRKLLAWRGRTLLGCRRRVPDLSLTGWGNTLSTRSAVGLLPAAQAV
jgi:HMG (high mobility group) box